MASMTACIGQKIKIGKTSITIKDENNKTRGVVKNMLRLSEAPTRIVFDYWQQLKKHEIGQKIRLNKCIIWNGDMWILHNMSSKSFYEKYGFFSNEEKMRHEETENIYEILRAAGFNIIDCFLLEEYN